MSERDLLLRAILERPDDDTARLVYADWLQENGSPDRAGFIRSQIALALALRSEGHYGAPADLAALVKWRSAHHAERAAVAQMRGDDSPCRCVLCLRPSESVAIERFGFTMADGLLGPEWKAAGDRKEAPRVSVRYHRTTAMTGSFQLEFGRGFVASVTCSLREWRAHGTAIMRAAPVSRIDLRGLRIEVDPPGEDHGWQAYYYRRGDLDYFTMNGWETREEMVVAIATLPAELAA